MSYNYKEVFIPGLAVGNDKHMIPYHATKYGLVSYAYNGFVHVVKKSNRLYDLSCKKDISKENLIDFLNKLQRQFYIEVEYFFLETTMEREYFLGDTPDTILNYHNTYIPYLIYISKVFILQNKFKELKLLYGQ